MVFLNLMLYMQKDSTTQLGSCSSKPVRLCAPRTVLPSLFLPFLPAVLHFQRCPSSPSASHSGPAREQAMGARPQK